MNDLGYAPLQADRFAAFTATLVFNDFDATGRKFFAQVRPTPNDTGTPLANLETTSQPSADGFRIISVNTNEDGTKTSFIAMTISAETIKAMPSAAGLSADQATGDADLYFAWDLQIEIGGVRQVVMGGPFILRAGVTQ